MTCILHQVIFQDEFNNDTLDLFHVPLIIKIRHVLEQNNIKLSIVNPVKD